MHLPEHGDMMTGDLRGELMSSVSGDIRPNKLAKKNDANDREKEAFVFFIQIIGLMDCPDIGNS